GLAALFHDIGMAEVDKTIVNKKRQLTKEERRVIDLYPLHTVNTLLKGRALDVNMIKRIIAAYEAKVDYSVPMKDQNGSVKLMQPTVELDIFGRITITAACYATLSSARAFRDAYGTEDVMSLLLNDMKYRLDPRLLKDLTMVMAIHPVKLLEQGARS